MITCQDCELDKEDADFPINGRRKDGTPIYRKLCKVCYNISQREQREGNPDKQERIRQSWRGASKKYMTTEKRRNKTLAKYDMTTEDYNRMFDEQDGLCAICKQPFVLVVDHCHTFNDVRGLLCSMCNTGLGMFGDDVDRLRQAMLYLEQAGSAR